ncbi:MAG TPA: fibronectin type III domain-containing protein [Pyrinomonadaceae bacterium]|nr:fibronectin type III domain-containing protein [Pyrinomonadaceae bacterium]
MRLLKTRILSAILCLIGVLAIGCGKRRPPLPPVERVQQRTELLSGTQQGNEVILSWPAPSRNAPDSSVQSIRRIDVYRLAEKPGAPLALTEDEFAARSTLVGSVTYEQIMNAGDTLTYRDALELAGQPTRLRYALRYVNASGQRAAFSNFLSIEPAARIAQAPALSAQTKLAEDAITITWQAPAANIDGSTPVNLLGYNVYRMDESQNEPSQGPINSALVSGTEYADKNFQFGNTYRYIVRSVSLGTGGAQVESLNSNSVEVPARDIFPPAPPEPPSIAPDPSFGRLAIFFAANKEPDIAGYNIYRSTDPNLPKDQWTKLNQSLLTRTTFQDERVESGKAYHYYLTAVDKTGNVSQPSAVASETVP